MNETDNSLSTDYSIYYTSTEALNSPVNIIKETDQNVTALYRTPSIWAPPLWRQILWCTGYGIMVIIATGGNLIVIWIVLAHKRMRTVTNYFLVNLSVADAMVSTFNVIFSFMYMLYVNWPFGETYCKISSFISVLSICASVLSLMSISIDRYIAIITPLKPRMGKTYTISFICMTWIVGIIIGTPSLLYYKTGKSNDTEGRMVCYMEWPDGIMTISVHEYVYNITFWVVTYFVPVALMIFTYARIGYKLWGSKSIGECTAKQLEYIKNKRKIVKMMMVVVAIFAICWLPYHLYFIITFYYPRITYENYIQETYLAIYWLAMSNSMYNPIIYCWMNARFRRGFKQVFRCFPLVKISPSNSFSRRDDTLSRRSLHGSLYQRNLIRNDSGENQNIRERRWHTRPEETIVSFVFPEEI